MPGTGAREKGSADLEPLGHEANGGEPLPQHVGLALLRAMTEEDAGDLHVLQHPRGGLDVEVLREDALPDPELQDLDDVALSEGPELLEAVRPVRQEAVKHAEKQVTDERPPLHELEIEGRELEHDLVRLPAVVDLLREIGDP